MFAGLYQVNRHLVRGLHSGGDVEQPAHLPRQALPRSAQPYPWRAGVAEPGGPGLYYQRKGMSKVGLLKIIGEF